MAEIWPGNQSFQKIVLLHVPQYHACLSRKDKNRITQEIVQLAYSKGIRFVKKDSVQIDKWVKADDETIRIRIGQSLRYLRNQQNDEAGGHKQKPLSTRSDSNRLPMPESSSGSEPSSLSGTQSSDPKHKSSIAGAATPVYRMDHAESLTQGRGLASRIPTKESSHHFPHDTDPILDLTIQDLAELYARDRCSFTRVWMAALDKVVTIGTAEGGVSPPCTAAGRAETSGLDGGGGGGGPHAPSAVRDKAFAETLLSLSKTMGKNNPE